MVNFADDELELDEFLLTLAAGHTRHVKTLEGSKFYGLPIGAPITADVIAAKKAEAKLKGIKAPKGALSKGDGQLSPHTKVPAPGKPAPAPKPPKVIKTALKGNQHFKVGNSDYSAPAGSKLIKAKGVDNVAYVRTPDGKVHAFTPKGEVEIPAPLDKVLEQKFGEDFTGDDQFDISDFDKTSASFGIEQMHAGDNLTDPQGNILFTKNNDGTWQDANFGLKLKEDDIKPMFDNGELIPEKTPTTEAAEQAFTGNENLNFADMSADELKKTLEGFPAGHTLEAGAGASGEQNYVTKNEDGTWKSSLTQNDLQPDSLYYLKSVLKNGKAPEDSAKDNLDAPDPLDADASGTAPTPKGKGETPDQAWINTSDPGAAFIYHGKSKDTTWTKNEDGTTWSPNGNQSIKIPNKKMGEYLANTNVQDLEISNQGKKKTTLGATPQDKIGKPALKEPPAPIYDENGNLKTQDAPKDSEPLADWEKELLAGADAEVEKKDKLNLFIDTANMGDKIVQDGAGEWEVTFKTQSGNTIWTNNKIGAELTNGDLKDKVKELGPYEFTTKAAPKAAPKPTKPDERLLALPGDKMKEHLDDLPVGSEIFSQGGTKLTKLDDGTWESEITHAHITSDILSTFDEGFLAKDPIKALEDNPETPHQKQLLMHLDFAAPGDTIHDKVGNTDWVKKDNGNWASSKHPDDASFDVTDDLFKEWIANPQVADSLEPGVSEQSDIQDVMDNEPEAPKFNIGDEVNAGDFINNAKIGDSFKDSLIEGVWTKTGDDQWTSNTGAKFHDDAMLGDFKDATATVVDGNENMHPTLGDLPKVGEPVKGVDAVAALPPKTKLAYTKKDGSESIYTTLDNGMILSPNGAMYAPEQLSGSLNSGKMKVHAYPDSVANPAPADLDAVPYDPNEKIDKFSHLKYMPIGTVIKDAGGPEYKGIQITKQDDGTWKVTNSSTGAFNGDVYTPGELADGITKGELYFVSAPDQTPQISDANDTQLWGGGPAFSKKDIQEAIDGLESHTGFQIAYGFKNIKNNPLADKDIQDNIKAEAVQKYPDLKPKPAFVQYLKDALGIVTPDTKKEKSDDNGPKVSIGSTTPKSTSGGMNGGEFSQAEIQDAINILENYQGKIFKSELNKKGNPLGVLNPVEIVGFDKDKNVTKQKFIDLLKQKLTPQAEVVKPTKVADMDELKSLPEGTILNYDNGSIQAYYTKSAPDAWMTDYGVVFPDKNFAPGIESGYVYVHSLPDEKPVYVDVPPALQDKIDDPVINLPEPQWFDEIPNADVGSILVSTDGKYYYTKIAPNTWSAVEQNSHKITFTGTDKGMIAMANNGEVENKKLDGPAISANGLTPGMYSSGGKAYMVIHADGSGVYVNSKGDVSSLTAAKIQKNYDAGMNLYGGMPKSVPTVKETPKPKVVEVNDLPNGTYYSGNPNAAKISVYEVTDDGVKVYKPKSSTGETGVKVGGKTTAAWMDQAAPGAVFHYMPYYSDKTLSKQGKLLPSKIQIKGQDGNWYTAEGEPTPEYILNDAKNFWTDSKVVSHGSGEPTTLTKNKLTTLYSQGALTDENGNAVLPKNYTGKAHFFGGETNVVALLKGRNYLYSPEAEDKSLAQVNLALEKLGIHIDQSLFKKYTEKHYGEWTNENGLTALKDSLENITAEVDQEIPTADTAALFNWDELGNAEYPLELAAKFSSTGYDNSMMTAFKTIASNSVGDGKIIGQHWTKMDKYDKHAWVESFKKGDFKNMYELEVAAAAKDGKAHVAGFKHPGYEDNEGTHKVQWAAAVKGEIPAGQTVEGDWTSPGIDPSMEEINNYLIKAQMQNPTHLTNSQRRSWVLYHRNGNKQAVDQLSALAEYRKQQNEPPVSEPLQWTDNVQPAKSYTKFFDDEKFPVTAWSSYQGGLAAQDYINDNPDNEELKKHYQQQLDEGHYNPAMGAVQAYFQAKADEEYQKSLIPVYTLKPNQTVKQSTHPVFEYSDQFGNHYFFKPRPDTKLDKYRSEVEHVGNLFGRLFGFNTADSKLETLDGKYGNLQKDVGGVADLMGYDYSTLTQQQIADIGKEHLLDLFLDNDDTKGDNAKILPNGHIVGIDKGRAFKHYGAWKGFSADESMNSNADTIYAKLYNAIRSGKLDKEAVDKAYLDIQKRARKMAKVSDETITDMLKEGMKNREEFDNSYTIDGKKVPNTEAGLIQAVLHRKNTMPEQIEAMWQKIYKDAGYGDLPEVPNKPLGDEVHSGFDAPELHDNILKVSSHGQSTMIGSADFLGGSATFWTDHNADGSQNVNMESFLAPKKAKALLDYLQLHATNADPDKSDPSGIEKNDIYGQSILSAAKTVNHHAADGEYNQEKINLFNQTEELLKKDLEAWSPTMESNTNDESYLFPSGQKVPIAQVDQYKLMLDHYYNQLDPIHQAMEKQEKTGHLVTMYEPMGLGNPPAIYTNGKKKLTKLVNGTWIYNDGAGALQTLEKDDAIGKAAAAGEDGWKPIEEAKKTKDDGGIKIKFGKVHDKFGEINSEGKLVYTNKKAEGVQGSEYDIVLPTGEHIYFKDSGATGTLASQSGKLSFKVNNVTDSSDSQAAMQRIIDALGGLGINTDAADPDTAELAYWREMYAILENRKHKTGSPYAKAQAAMYAKRKEIKSDENHFLENLSEIMSVEEQNAFWRKIWGDQFGHDKVQSFIDEEKYLPWFTKGDFNNPEIGTGKPMWNRFDVDMEEILKRDKVLYSSSSGNVDKVALTGALSTEERIRVLGSYVTNGMSSGADQGNGASHIVYTRIGDTYKAKTASFIYHPRVLLRTRTFGYHTDHWGKPELRKDQAPSNPLDALDGYGKEFGGSIMDNNETDIPHAATLLDDLEMVIFDDINERNKVIQELKKKGLDMIRGLPVEDRLVMRQGVEAAIAKVKKTWAL